jgi:rRNA processing protein Gar1
MGHTHEDEHPVAWTAMPPRAPVFDAGGGNVGTVEAVLGDVARGIFHGVVVKRQTDGRPVEILADDVGQITTERMRTSLTTAEVAGLPVYEGAVGGLEGILRRVGDKLETT